MASRDGLVTPPLPVPPLEFGGDALIWSTWLYYAEALTQNDVAHALGVSRASIANYLAEARRRGLVTVNIAPDLLSSLTESRALAERFGLAGALVVPFDGTVTEDAALRHRVGVAAAHALLPRLREGMTLGVAWGRTMLEVARALPERSIPSLRVVQVSGSSLGDADSSPEACTALIAGRLGARCQNFHAPAVVSRREVRDALLTEPTLERQLARLRASEVVVFGVGELGPGVTWSDDDFLIDKVVEDYLARRAVAVLIGRFVDAAGREVDGPLSGRQIGMELAELAAVPIRLCVAGGRAKIDAIRATLSGGYATHLVTDAGNARALLEGAP